MMDRLDPNNAHVQRIAKALVGQGGRADEVKISVGEYALPSWIFYVREAQKIWEQHIILHDLTWDGKPKAQ